LAYNHIARYQDAESKLDRKHTFWVDATSAERLSDAVRTIAQRISLPFPDEKGLFTATKAWLQDDSNGAWFIVIDGLNLLDDEVTTQLRQLLPRDRGQVLVTTQDCSVLDMLEEIFVSKRRSNRLHVHKLKTTDLYEIFEWHVDEPISATEQINELLDYLYLPAIVQITAKWANDFKTSVSNLHDMIIKRQQNVVSVKLPEQAYERFTAAHQIFQTIRAFHTTGPRIKLQEWPNHTARLLGVLSCLDHERMDFQLVRKDHNREDRLREMLGSLENCSFISKATDNIEEGYTMHRIVQELMCRWTVEHMGTGSLLCLHQTALCVLVLHYKAKKKALEGKTAPRLSYHWKIPLMCHFEHFLSFARLYAPKLDASVISVFECDDRMAYSVITFARVYLDEGRFDDAACVLHLSWRLYRGHRYRSPLVRQLCEAYTLPPLASRNQTTWAETTAHLERVVDDFKEQPGSDREQEWLCLLALANMYSKTLQPVPASKFLARLHELNLDMQGDGPQVTTSSVNTFEPQADRRKLAIHKRVAEARLHLAWAECASSNSLNAKHLRKALEYFTQARSAAYIWYPLMDKWTTELDEDIADIWSSMGDPESVRKALGMYGMLLRGYENDFIAPDRPWSKARIWDLKCKVAYTQLKLSPLTPDRDTQEAMRTQKALDAQSPSDTRGALDVLRNALAFYEESFGANDEHTRVCAHLLFEIYRDRRMAYEAKELETRYSLESVYLDNAHDFVSEGQLWAGGLPISCVLIVSIALVVLIKYRRSSL
jgi:hypothetical protein